MKRGLHKDNLLESGLALMYRHGFAATGVQHITDASGVPKGSFYNYFKSKEDFALEALEYYVAGECEQLEATLVNGKGSPLTRLRTHFKDWIQQLTHKGYVGGCFAGNLCQELADVSPTFRLAVDRAFQRIQRYLTTCLREAQKAREISPQADVEELSAFLLNSWQGAVLRMKASGSDEPLRKFQHVVFDRVLR